MMGKSSLFASDSSAQTPVPLLALVGPLTHPLTFLNLIFFLLKSLFLLPRGAVETRDCAGVAES